MLEEWLIEEGTRITRAWVPSARLVHIYTRSQNLGDRQCKRKAQNPGLPPTPIYVLISPLRLPPGGCCEDCRALCGIRLRTTSCFATLTLTVEHLPWELWLPRAGTAPSLLTSGFVHKGDKNWSLRMNLLQASDVWVKTPPLTRTVTSSLLH